NVLIIWADATKKEEVCYKAKDGLVFRLDSSNTMKCGDTHNQQPLVPPLMRKTRSKEASITFTDLTLRDVHFAVQALIMDFDKMWFKVAFRTHVSVQLYSCEQWETSIA
ncbi:hypothetical protein FA15DRAFT_560850, partial [Coprinopsis marcescibilis]